MVLDNIRQLFPQLNEKVYNKPLVYLDNAATSMRPQSVIDKWDEMSAHYNSNLHRAVHYLAGVATEEYESTRNAVKDFINAESREEIVFTSGTTASINLVAFSFGEAFIKPGDEVLVTECEHHSNIVPWQMMCERKGAKLKVVPVNENGEIDLSYLRENLTEQSKILACAQISNVLGVINPINDIVNICHSKGCAVLTDGAQGVVHSAVNVQDLDCDFYVFSGHKIFAAPGTGVLYGKKKWLEKMPPYMGGGEMIATVKFTGTTYAPLPGKFEAGTQNIAGTPTLKQAIATARLLRSEEIVNDNERTKDYVYDALTSDKRIRLYGTPEDKKKKIGLFSFTVDGAHHEDLALLLDKMGIAVRSGQMCAEPIMDRFGVTGMLRASFAPYNTMEEAEYFIKSLDRAIKMLV